MMTKQVTEIDFRMPEFRDAKVEDYEFRQDGKLVRKDRWERGIRSIVEIVNMSSRDFEVIDVIENVRKLYEHVNCWFDIDDVPEKDLIVEIKLEDGSILRNANYSHSENNWKWCGENTPLDVIAWREQ